MSKSNFLFFKNFYFFKKFIYLIYFKKIMFSKIKNWFLLRKVKKEEKKHIPTDDEINNEHELLKNQEKEVEDLFIKK